MDVAAAGYESWYGVGAEGKHPGSDSGSHRFIDVLWDVFRDLATVRARFGCVDDGVRRVERGLRVGGILVVAHLGTAFG